MIYFGVPSHNEGRTVGVLLWKIRKVMTEFPRDYQLIVVDDASTDATAEVLEPYARVLPLTVIRFHERQGYAACIETLVREAVKRSSYPRRDVLVTLQADFTDDPEEIPNLLKRIESGADVVTSALRVDPHNAPRALRWTVRLAAPLLRRRMAWPEPVTDALSTFRAYRIFGLRKALDTVDGRGLLAWDGWAANAALLEAVRPHVRRMDEIEVLQRLERRQRESRFEAWPTFRSLVRLAFGRPAPLASPRDPDSAERTITGDPGLAERVAATEHPIEPEEPRRRRRTRKASDHTRERKGSGVSGRKRSSRNGATPPKDDQAGQEAAGEARGSSRRRRKSSRQPASTDAPAAAAADEVAGAGEEEGGKPRRSRRRRGGRRGGGRRRTAGEASANGGSPEEESSGSSEPASAAEASGVAEGNGAAPKASSRRRRRGGRGRGGRRRRSGGSGSGSDGAGGGDTGNAGGGEQGATDGGARSGDAAASPGEEG